MGTYFDQISLEEVMKITGIAQDGLAIKDRPIRVLLVDDSDVMRRSIRGLLEQDPEIKVVAEAENFSQTVRFANDLKPEIIVMDLYIKNDPMAISEVKLRLKDRDTRIVAISLSNDEETRALADHFGAMALLDKMTLVDDLIPTIKRFASTRTPV